jgi:hypothetical protein
LQAEGVVLSKNTGQNRQYEIYIVWASESENKRNRKSNFSVILLLIFAAFTKDCQSSGNKNRAMGTLCLSNYHMYIIYQHSEASNEYIRRIVLIPFVFVIKYQSCQITQE